MATATKEAAAPKPATAGTRQETKPFVLASLALAETRGLRWRLDCPEGVSPADLEDVQRWAVVASRLSSFDFVEAVGFGGRWWAEVLIVQAERASSIELKVLRVVELSPARVQERALPQNHEIRFDRQTRTYTAFRISDNVPLTSGVAQWSDAYAALMAHATLRGA